MISPHPQHESKFNHDYCLRILRKDIENFQIILTFLIIGLAFIKNIRIINLNSMTQESSKHLVIQASLQW